MIIGVIDYMINLTVIIRAFIGLIAAIATYFLIPLLKKKLGAEKLAEAVEWARIGVQAAEMLWKGYGGSGAEKKAFVMDFLKEKGFTYDDKEIDIIVEAAVLDMKAALMDYEAVTEGADPVE